MLAGLAAGGVVVAQGVPGATAGPLDDLLGSLVSPEQEQELGVQAFDKIKREVPRSGNRDMQTRLERVGEKIVAASQSEVPADRWEFVVFASDEINAFALPGGKVGFFEGIFKLFADDAQLATVLGHEIGHVNARHSAERIGAQTASQLGASIVAQVLGLSSQSGMDQIVAGLLGAGAQYGVLMPYARGQELEADRLGLTYMARAGYDPAESIDFWRKMMKASGNSGPAFLSTHPSDEERIARIQEMLPEAEAIYRQSR
jgi:predicted Zn-dependent protease